MSVKKPSIEEQMAQSIFYNLSILKLAVKSTSDFDENLSNTMFIKSNTKAFIHITHYLFNIIDPKEFKAKFYWPLAEKKSENSYRSSSIDLINSLIDKHSLKHEKVKLVFVVHPGGKKFMSLILDLITIAIKEVMKRRRIAPGQSFSMATVMQTCINMKEVETDLVNSIKEETKLVKDKTRAIQDLINKDIFPEGDLPLPFQEFIAAWHENNKAQFAAIKSRDNQMNEIYKQTAELQIRAQELLATKSFEIVEPSPQVIKEIADFYENVGLNDDTIPEPVVNEKLNFAWLIVQLHLVLPSIINYVTSFKLEASESNVEELKVVQRLASELSKIESKIINFSAKFKNVIGELIVKLKKAKEERQQNEQEIESPEKIAAKLVKNQIELENLKLLSTPRYYFDTTKECLRHVVIEKKRLAMLDDETKENLANETKLYRPAKSPYMNKSRLNQSSMVNQMGPPKQQLRRRLDPMELMNRATAGTSRNRRDFDSTARYTGAIPKTSQGFSSTMLSPCLHQPLFNCSTVSEISNNSPATPVMTVENIFHETEKLLQPKDFDLNIFKTQTKPVFSPQDISWNDEEKMMKYHTSPRGGLTSLVRAEEIFKQPPKLTVNELTLLLGNETVKDPSTSPETSETTIVNKSDTKSFSLLSADENLFNTSDTILNELSD